MKVPSLHVVATDAVAAARDFERLAERLLNAGGAELALHLRVRERTARDLHRLASRLSERARASGSWTIVNGRLDVALTAGATGVQLGAGALPVAAARRVAGDRLRLGASVHSRAEARAAVSEDADFLVVGAIFPTATHPGRPPAGPELIGLCAAFGRPVVAIGGIEEPNVDRVVAAGAAGVAVVRAVWTAPDPVRAAADLLARLAEARNAEHAAH